MTPEFFRPERLDAIGEGARSVSIEADADERRRLAARFSLLAIDSLTASFTLKREAAGILVTGRVTATVTQACSVTDDPLPATVDEPVLLRFVEPAEHGEEAELGEDLIDTIELEGAAIDLGETAAETVALALDPFPRGPRAAEALRAAGVVGEDEAGPFNAFTALRDKLGK